LKEWKTKSMSDESRQIQIANDVIDLWTKGKVRATSEEAFKQDRELATVVCSPVAKTIGSKQARCACGAIMYVSAQAQIAIQARGDLATRLICLSCFQQEYGKEIEKAKNEEATNG